MNAPKTSRRGCLKWMGTAACGAVAGFCVARRIGDFGPGVSDSPWLALTALEVETLEAVAEQLIPADEVSPGAKDAGCIVYLDRQLVADGPYAALLTTYRRGISALNAMCRQYSGKRFSKLNATAQTGILVQLEQGTVPLEIWKDLKPQSGS